MNALDAVCFKANLPGGNFVPARFCFAVIVSRLLFILGQVPVNVGDADVVAVVRGNRHGEVLLVVNLQLRVAGRHAELSITLHASDLGVTHQVLDVMLLVALLNHLELEQLAGCLRILQRGTLRLYLLSLGAEIFFLLGSARILPPLGMAELVLRHLLERAQSRVYARLDFSVFAVLRDGLVERQIEGTGAKALAQLLTPGICLLALARELYVHRLPVDLIVVTVHIHGAAISLSDHGVIFGLIDGITLIVPFVVHQLLVPVHGAMILLIIERDVVDGELVGMPCAQIQGL